MADARRTVWPLARGILYLRLAAAILTAPALVGGDVAGVALACAALVVASSVVPLLAWRRVVTAIERHPALLALDILCSAVLLVLVGPTSPFFLVTIASAALGGVLYGRRGAAVFSVLLVSTYALAAFADLVAAGGAGLTFQLAVGNPLLYLLTAFAAAGVRALLDRQAAMETELALAATAAAAADERARLARELHDSVGKTLHGIAFGATALARRLDGDPRADAARILADAAMTATGEARTLLDGMRADRLDEPFPAVVADLVDRWSSRVGLPAEVVADDVVLRDPGTRYEVLAVVGEALRNVERHAAADRVAVSLHDRGGDLEVVVGDDGRGFDGDRRATLVREGHYGLQGMAERAASIDAALAVDTAPGRGTRVVLRVPMRAQHGRLPSAPAGPPAVAEVAP